MSIQTNQNNTKPVIFLAFANPTAGTQEFLRDLGEEARQLENVIRQAQADNLCELVIKPHAGLSEIVEVFREYRDRIAIFHYAGHAKNFILMLLEESDENPNTENVNTDSSNTGRASGDNRDTTMIDGRGLAAFLGAQNSLQLVFLNACSTQPQVDELLKANVPAVIATSQSIRDDVATMLATHFYQSLTSGSTLQKAFSEAEGLTQAVVGTGNMRDAYFEDDVGVAMTELHDWPWRLTLKPGAEQLAEWNLVEAANEPLFGLPALPEHDLPESPFRHLNFFTEQDAELFFGRGHQIRHLYDLVTTPDSAPIILFYGKSGVGKSSMLAAGLLPRLQEQTIHYVRRDQGLGLTGTLAQTLWVGETMPERLDAKTIAKRWHELEQRSNSPDIKPLAIVLDQVEEIFTRPNPDQPDELAAFLDVLIALFAHQPHRLQGKLILGFRKEWLADIEDAIKSHLLPHTKHFLSRLDHAGIVEAVTGVVRSKRLQTHYHLTVEPGLADSIADDMLDDPDSPVAPTLQILLTKMWTQATIIQPDQPYFDMALYQSLKREGLLLNDFLQQQLEQLHAWRAEVVDSGLALDMLATHTTPQGTVDHHTEAELLEMYRHLAYDIPPLIQKCEELYLLFNPVKEQADQPKSSRLAHDALAPLIRHQYEESDRPGQRARRILDSRVVEWEDEDGQPIEGNPLDESDLNLVEGGLQGTRDLTELEQRLLEASREAQVQREQDRKRQRRLRNGLTLLVAVAAVVAFFLWRQSEDRRVIAETQTAIAQEQTALAEDRRVVAEEQTAIAEEQTALAEDRRVVAEEQTEIAQEQTALAVERRIIAEAQNMASQSQLLILDDKRRGDAALILARDAVLTNPNTNTDQALRFALNNHPLHRTIPDGNLHHTADVTSVAYSPDGQTVASASDDGTIRLWRADNLTPVALLFGHTGSVLSVSYSPDGAHIVSGSSDRTVRIWDITSRTQVAQLNGHIGYVNSVSYSPDGSHIVSGGRDTTVRIWNVASGEQVTQLQGHTYWVESVSYSPDGTHIVSAGGYDRTVRIWNVSNGEQVAQFDGYWPIRSASYSPDGGYIVTGGDDQTVRVWDITNKEQVAQLAGHWFSSVSLSYSPDGTHIVSAGWYENTIRIWEVANKVQTAQFDGHSITVNSVAYSPDGRYVVSGGDDQTVRVWNIANGEQVEQSARETDPGPINSVSYSPDSAYIVTGGTDQTVRLWSVAKGKQVARLDGHTDSVESVSYSPDGTHVVSGSMDQTVRIWSVASGEQVIQLDGHTGSVRSVSYSPDGTHIVSGSDDQSIRIWDVASGEQIAQFDGHTDSVRSVSYSPDGTYIVSGGDDQTARIWSVRNREQVAQLDGYSDSVHSVSYSPDGTHIVSGGRTVRIWDVASGRQVAQLDGHFDSVYSVSYSPDGTHIVSGGFDQTVRLWEVANRTQIAQFDEHLDSVFAVSYSPDGRRIVSGGWDSMIRLWNVNNDENEIQLNGHLGNVSAVSYSPDGRYIVSGSDDSTVRVWEVASGEQVIQFEGHLSEIISVSYSPDGQYIASGSYDGTMRIWEVASGEQVAKLDGHSDVVSSVSYSPDGRHVVFNSGNVYIWDIASGEQVAQFDGRSDASYSPDGRHIVSAGVDRTVRIWEVASGEQIAQLDGHTDWIRSMSYSPDGRYIASGSDDNTVRIWDVASGEQVALFEGHSEVVYSVAYSPDGKYIVSGSHDGTVRIWEVVSGEQVAEFNVPSSLVWSVSYSPDGRHVVSGGLDNTVRIWETPPLVLLKSITQISRPAPILTTEEREQAGIDPKALLPNQAILKPLMTEAQAYTLVEEGHALAVAQEIDKAAEKFETALTTIAPLDKDALKLSAFFDIDPIQKAIEIAVSALIHEGNRLARAGDVVNATDKFAEAVTLSPELTIKPELEAIRIAALANKQAGERLAQAGEVISATLKFEAAMALDPFLAIEPEPEARRLAALAFLDQAWTDENERSKARELLDELTEQMPSLTVGSPVTATTASIPYWHFTGTVGQMVMISLVYTEDGQFDPPLKLYDANGNILSEGDADPKVSNGYDAFIEAFTLPETGTYFVKAGRPDSSAVYELMVLSESTEAGTE